MKEQYWDYTLELPSLNPENKHHRLAALLLIYTAPGLHVPEPHLYCSPSLKYTARTTGEGRRTKAQTSVQTEDKEPSFADLLLQGPSLTEAGSWGNRKPLRDWKVDLQGLHTSPWETPPLAAHLTMRLLLQPGYGLFLFSHNKTLNGTQRFAALPNSKTRASLQLRSWISGHP